VRRTLVGVRRADLGQSTWRRQLGGRQLDIVDRDRLLDLLRTEAEMLADALRRRPQLFA
jgi:hypothetical protein